MKWLDSIVLSWACTFLALNGGTSLADSRLEPIDVLFDVDQRLVETESLDSARREADRLSGDLAICFSGETIDSEHCLVRTILSSLSPVPREATPLASTVAHALSKGKGTCAALVALVIAMAEHFGLDLGARVFDEHVVLASTARPGVYYETLQSGRELIDLDLMRYQRDPALTMSKVSGSQFTSYYLDNLAVRFAQAGQRDTADWLFSKAVEHGPHVARVRFHYGTFLLSTGRARKAARQLSRAATLDPQSAAILVNLGAVQVQLGKHRFAERSFRSALAIDPANQLAHKHLKTLSAPE